MTASHVDVPGGRLFVLDDGAGPPLILLHAGIADHRAWDAMVPPLTAAGYRVIRFDARGLWRVDDRGRRVLAARRPAGRAWMRSGSGGRSSSATRAAGCSPSIPRSKRPSGSPRSSGWRPAWPASTAGRPRPRPVIEAEYERIDAAGDAAALTAFETRIWVDGPLQPAGRVAAPIRDLVSRDEPAAQRTSGHVAGKAIPLEPPARDRLAGAALPGPAGGRQPRLLGRRDDGTTHRGRGARRAGGRSGRTSPT